MFLTGQILQGCRWLSITPYPLRKRRIALFSDDDEFNTDTLTNLGGSLAATNCPIEDRLHAHTPVCVEGEAKRISSMGALVNENSAG